MKRLFFFFLIFIFAFWGETKAQRRGTGLILDEKPFHTLPIVPFNVNSTKADNLAARVSLKSYCPTPGDQGATNSCVGWASGYAAMTICRAIQENITDKTAIDKMAHSAMYVYSKIKIGTDCNSGATLSSAINLMKQEGVCRALTFDNVLTNCTIAPPAKADSEAANFRIKDFCAAFNFADAAMTKLNSIRRSIAAHNPVIVGMKVYDSFYAVTEGQQIWSLQPNDTELKDGHAMVVVGYDEFNKRFELLNSWGAKWGNNGFISINYDDFAKLILSGYIIMLEEPKPLKTSSEFVFRYPVPNSNGTNAKFEEAKAQYDTLKKRYELLRKDWKAGETVFQIIARNIPKGKYVYVFSVDATGKSEIHFPQNIKGQANFMLVADAEIIIPDADNALLLSVKGEDNLCILYADKAITDFMTRFEKLTTTKGSFNEQLNKVFGDLFAPDNTIRYEPNAMKFEIKTNNVNDNTVIPLVLTVNAE